MRVALIATMLAACAATLLWAGDSAAPADSPAGHDSSDLRDLTGRSIHRLPVHAEAADHVNFVLWVPPADRAPDAGYPLILFLHGSEQRGDDPSVLEDLPILAFTEQDPGFPFVALVPQCPRGTYWSPAILKQLLEAVEGMVRIDRSRVYLTGFSMGGYGTWQTAAALPGVFAAIAPLCGMADLPDARVLAGIPTWVFHGAQDRNVPLSESLRMVETLRREGADTRLTVYPDLAHDCWTMTYRDSRLYLWFLTHTRAESARRD